MQRGPGLACGHAWLLIGGTMGPRAAGDSRVMVLLLLLLHPMQSTPFGAVTGKVSPYPNPSASYSRPSPGAEEPPGRQTRLLATTSKGSEASRGKALLPPQAAETHVGRPRDPIPPEPGRAERMPPAERGAHQSASGAREGGPALSLTAQSSTEPRLSPQVGALSALGSTRTDTPSEALRRTEPHNNVEVRKEVLKASEPAGRYALGPTVSKGTRALAHARSEEQRAEAGIPLAAARTVAVIPSENKIKEAGIPAEQGRTDVGIPLEPGRTEVSIPSEPGRTEVGIPLEPGRTEVGSPSEPGRTEVGIPLEPGRTEVGIPLEPVRTELGIPSEPMRTEVGIQSAPGRTEVGIPSEPGRTEVGIPSLPGRTERSIPSEPVRTEVGIQSAPGRTEVGIPSEPGRTEVGIPSEPGRTEVGIPSLPGRTERSIPSEPVRTEVGIRSAPDRTEVGIPSEPGRTEVGIPSEPGRTEVGIPSLPGRTERSIPSEPVRTEVGIRSAPDRTEGGIPSESGRTVRTLWQSETHMLSEPERTGVRILSDARKAHAQLPPVQGSTEPLPPSEPWRTEVRMLSDITEASSPPDQLKPEAPTLPQLGREGLGWPGIVGQGRASQRNTIGVHTSQALVPSGVQTRSELVTTDTPTPAKPNKKGADTPPEPGGTGALPEWDQAQTQHGPERTAMAIKTPTRTASSQYWRPPEQGMVRGQTISTTGASGVSNLSKTGTSNNKTAPELYVTTPDAISGLVGHTTRAPPAPYGLTANTTSRRGETIRQYSSEPSGTETQTSNGSKFVETTTKAQSETIWPRLNIVSGTETDVRGNSTLQEDGWTGTYGAAEQDWAGFGEQTEVQSVSASDTMLVSEQGKGNSNQPVRSSDTEKKTSHTDSMYISTTFNRGGERTLLSITNGSASSDITESSTYYNVSKTSDPPDSSWAENSGRTKKLKGDTDFTIDSWENFLKRSSKTSTHSSQTSYPGVESQEPMDNSYDIPIGGSNTADPSEGSHATISKSEYNSIADSFSSSLRTSLSSASSSQLSETFPSTSSQSLLSSDSGISTSFVLPAPSTVSVLSSPSVTEGPPYSASASTPHLTLSPVPGIPLASSPVPTSFSDVPHSLSTSPSSSSHSLPSQSPSSLYSSSMSIPLSPSLPPSTTPSSASLPAESFQPTPTPLARKRTEDSSTPLYYSTVTSNSALGTEDKEAMASTTLLTSPSALSTERFNGSSKMDVGRATESFTEGTITAKGDFFAKTTVFLGTERVSTQGTLQTEVPKQATSSVPDAPMLTDQFTTLKPTTRKTVPAISRTSETQSLEPTTESSVLFGTPSTQPVHTTSASATPGESTAHLGLNTTTNKSTAQTLTPAVSHKPIHPVKTTYMIPTVTPKPSTMAASKSTATPLATSHATVGICLPNPCLHGGRCVLDNTTSTYKCVCTPSWTGEQCATDVDECLSNPCPSKATCINAPGSFTCRCPLGYQLEKGAGCSLVRTFLGQIKISSRFKNSSDWNPLEQGDIEGEIAQMFSMSLAMIEGYNTSTILDTRETSDTILSVQHIFSFESNVTIYDIMRSLQNYMKSCDTSDTRPEHCRLLAQYQLYYKADSLCHQKYPECDKETSECTDLDGIAICQCRTGYFKYSKMDYSCRACEDGFKRENGTCVRCPFGLGGFNCGNPYQLITIVIAAAGGGLLLILGTALIITCCRKNKNDISKLIFKSGDFQMSPYAEYPKNPRSSEWGREAIEMQENGSTKNLLQVADVYYSQPGLRNPELERNGLFPYTGVPGSRHSCIYPGQYNPSFLNEESRRRDYF